MLAVRWLKEDPIRFLELLPKIPIETRDMIGGSFAEGVASGSPEQIGELFAKYEPLIGITGRGEFASNLVRQLVERTPANWQESVSQLIPKFSTNETRSFAAQAAFRLAVNPIALALSLETTGGLTSHTMPTFENELEKRVLADPSFVGEWLNTCPKGEVRDHAASVYAKAINLVNPAAAAAWARQIDNLTLQQAILLELGSAKGH